MKPTLSYFCLLFSVLLASSAYARDSHPLDKTTLSGKYRTEKVFSGVSIPWGITQLPSGVLVVTERSGKLMAQLPNRLAPIEISGLPEIENNGQGGLLDLVLSPNYRQEPWIYFTYASAKGEGRGSNTALARALLDEKSWRLDNLEILYKGKENSTSGRHFGSRIAFDDAGYVYFSIGDRGDRDVNPQSLSRDGGKIYRLHIDGRIPQDNPFVNGENPAVYSYGHRNPQGLLFDRNRKQLWSHEHGPRGGDEINLVEAGKNYGWPVVSYGINYSGTKFTELTHQTGMEQPSLYWDPSIAPSAFIKVTSKKYPKLKGKYLLGSLKFGYIVVITIQDTTIVSQQQLLSGLGRVRSLHQGVDGNIYIGLDGSGIVKLIN